MAPEHSALIERMTLEEKVGMLAGSGLWHAPGVERLDIPPFKVTDGPNGARGEAFRAGTTAACFPCGTALAATWNVDLVQRVGAALGEEAQSKGAHVLLAPTVNIHRSPLGGRNFECYSEDPHLSARMAVAFVRGVQAQGVATTVKHFVCNDSEFERHTISSDVDERALREIYLVPFEAAVREAGAWGIMSAYNKINGTWASENDALLNGVLRDEWGFDGFVISDWFGTNSSAPCANGGLDLEMPGPARHFGANLLQAVTSGEVDEATIDAHVARLLRLRERTGVFDAPEPRPEQAIDLPAHRELARQAAAESFVLLRNERSTLPLDARALSSLAVIGPNADIAVIQGGGSAGVNPHYAVSPLEGLRARLPDTEFRVERGCTNHRTLPTLGSAWLDDDRGLQVEFWNSVDFSGEPVSAHRVREADFTWMGHVTESVDAKNFSARLTGRLVAPESGTFSFGLVSIGLSRVLIDGVCVVDNWTSQTPGDSYFGAGTIEEQGAIELVAGRAYDVQVDYAQTKPIPLAGLRVGCLRPVREDQLERAVAAARAADAAVVVVGLNRDWETEGRDRDDMELPGDQAELIEQVAAANPRTIVVLNAGSPVRMPWLASTGALLQIWYPGQELGHALAAVLVGDSDASGRLPTTFPKRIEDHPAHGNYPGQGGHVRYEEGVLVGYRHYDTRDVEPLFAFGHGLSYTRFEYGVPTVSAGEIGPDDGLEVHVEVRNAGTRRGHEVVQLYVRDPECSLPRPEKELAGFAKLELEAGASRTVRFRLDRRALSHYDPAQHAWVAEPGEFEAWIGSSSRDIRARVGFRLKA